MYSMSLMWNALPASWHKKRGSIRRWWYLFSCIREMNRCILHSSRVLSDQLINIHRGSAIGCLWNVGHVSSLACHLLLELKSTDHLLVSAKSVAVQLGWRTLSPPVQLKASSWWKKLRQTLLIRNVRTFLLKGKLALSYNLVKTLYSYQAPVSMEWMTWGPHPAANTTPTYHHNEKLFFSLLWLKCGWWTQWEWIQTLWLYLHLHPCMYCPVKDKETVTLPILHSDLWIKRGSGWFVSVTYSTWNPSSGVNFHYRAVHL